MNGAQKYVRGPFVPVQIRQLIEDLEALLQSKVVISDEDLRIIYEAANRYRLTTKIGMDNYISRLVYKFSCEKYSKDKTKLELIEQFLQGSTSASLISNIASSFQKTRYRGNKISLSDLLNMYIETNFGSLFNKSARPKEEQLLSDISKHE